MVMTRACCSVVIEAMGDISDDHVERLERSSSCTSRDIWTTIRIIREASPSKTAASPP